MIHLDSKHYSYGNRMHKCGEQMFGQDPVAGAGMVSVVAIFRRLDDSYEGRLGSVPVPQLYMFDRNTAR